MKTSLAQRLSIICLPAILITSNLLLVCANSSAEASASATPHILFTGTKH
jgi:hypothetical protein